MNLSQDPRDPSDPRRSSELSIDGWYSSWASSQTPFCHIRYDSVARAQRATQSKPGPQDWGQRTKEKKEEKYRTIKQLEPKFLRLLPREFLIIMKEKPPVDTPWPTKKEPQKNTGWPELRFPTILS